MVVDKRLTVAFSGFDGDPQTPRADFVNVNFILAYVTLQRLSTTWDPKETVRLFKNFFYPLWTEEADAASQYDEPKVIEDTIARMCERVPHYGKRVTKLDRKSVV